MEDEASDHLESSSEEENSQTRNRVDLPGFNLNTKNEVTSSASARRRSSFHQQQAMDKRTNEITEPFQTFTIRDNSTPPSTFTIDDKEPRLIIKKYMLVDLNDTFTTEESPTYDEIGFAVWLSNLSVGAPALACTISAAGHPEWCNHKCSIRLMLPQSTKPITWKEEKRLPVNCCIRSLAVNTFNRDMFAAGTIAGDLYIWMFNQSNEQELVKQLFMGSSRCGSIMAMDFYQLSPLVEDYVLLTCHDDGKVCSWKVGRIVVLDKKVRFYDAKFERPFYLTAICNSFGSNFFVGTLNGSILGPCTMGRTIDSSDGRHQDCVFELYSKHKFTVTRLERVVYKGVEHILSSDYYSELRLFKLGNLDGEKYFDYRLPLLSDHYSLICGEYVIIARRGGELQYFKLEKPGVFDVENTLRGIPSCIAMSRNQNWLVTGSFEGKFQVYSVES